jgi:RnfABCDGE-type electron transport complex B subunit
MQLFSTLMAINFDAPTVIGLAVSAVLLIMALGATLGALLAYAARKLHVEQAPRIAEITAVLPGANCGGCGLPGCAGYAEAIVRGECTADKCAPGGVKVARMIAHILGMDVTKMEKRYAVLQCKGGNMVARKFDYAGVTDCRAAALVQQGDRICRYGCIGLGTCAAVCPFNAIVMRDGLPYVVEDNCTACGACVRACPNHLFSLVGESKVVVVGCQSHDPGRIVNKICPVGCIACKACEKACPCDAIHVIDNLAVIDYAKCQNCGQCVKVCPKSTIYDMRHARDERHAREGRTAPVEEPAAPACKCSDAPRE